MLFEILLGVWLIVIALLPFSKFYPGRLGTKQRSSAIEPSWIPRLILLVAGIVAILDGIRTLNSSS